MIIIDDDGIMHKVLPMDTLDKIKAEIEHVKDNPLFGMVSKDTILEVILEIIDKYRNEVNE